MLSPFDNDAADNHHSDDADKCRCDTVLGITDGSLDLIKSDNSCIMYDPGSIGFSKDSALGSINDSDGSSLPYDPGGIGTSSTLDGATQDSSDDTTDDCSPSSTHTPSPFDNDTADGHHSNDADDHRHNAIFGTTNNILGLIKSDDSHIVYNPGSIGFSKDSTLGGIHFDNSLGSDLGNTAISDDASSFNSSCRKFVYNPGGDRPNSTTEADSAREGNDDPGSDTNHECDERDFIYDPGGDLLVNNTTISTAHDDTPVSHHEPAQAKRLNFNAAPPSSAAIHPSLPSANSLPQSDEDADAALQPNIQDVATTAATSKQSELGLTGDGQFLKPPGRCKECTHTGLGMGSALSSCHLTFARPLNQQPRCHRQRARCLTPVGRVGCVSIPYSSPWSSRTHLVWNLSRIG